MKASNAQHSITQRKPLPHANRSNQRFQASQIDIPSRKFSPASRTERLSSWNQRLQSLFTRQTY